MYVCSLIAWEQIHQLAQNLAYLCLETWRSWVQDVVRVVPVAWKLRIEEQCQDWSWLLWRGNYRNKGHNSKKKLLGSSPIEDGFCTQKLSTTEKWCKDQSCLFWQGDYRDKGQNSENFPGFESEWERVFVFWLFCEWIET